MARHRVVRRGCQRGSERAFLTAYERASGHSWTDRDIRGAWAAGLWTRAFDAKKASLVGADPAAALTKTEAKERALLAGL